MEEKPEYMEWEKENGKPDTPPEVLLHGKAYTHAQFTETYKTSKKGRQKRSACQKISESCSCSKASLVTSVLKKVPIIDVLRTYKIKEMVLSDILAGISVAILHIPMGMGFGLIASLTPIYGLYTSFFPVVVYAIFGTSPHTSFGSNAVIAIMVAAVVEKQANLRTFNDTIIADNSEINLSLLTNDSYLSPYHSSGASAVMSDERLQFQVSVAAASSLVVGIILGAMGFLRLGILSIFFSDPVVSGFTFGVSLQITGVQLSSLLGLRLPSRIGSFRLIFTLYDVFTNLKSINIAALVISLISLFILIVVKEYINQRFKNKLPLPIPIDFLLVLFATIASHFARFSEKFELPVVNKVPTGLAAPSLPEITVIPSIIMDCVVIAILVFALSMSVAKFLAKQMQYSIDENQELVAYGASNVLCGFFQCFPSCQAPPRAMMFASMNGKTTLAGIFSSAIVLIVLLVVGKYMEALPISVLAALIIVSLSGLYRNILDTKKFWKLNKWDFVIWSVTAGVITIVDIDIGLYAGVGISLIAVILQTRQSSGVVLGLAEKDDYMVDVNSSDKVRQIAGIKIFQFHAPLYFGNAELFKKRLYSLVLDPDIKHHKTEVYVPDVVNSTPEPNVLNSTSKQNPKQNVLTSTSVPDPLNSASEQTVINSTPEQNVLNSASEQNVLNSASVPDQLNSASEQTVINSTPEQNVLNSTPEQNVLNSAPEQNSSNATSEQNALNSIPERNPLISTSEQNVLNSTSQPTESQDLSMKTLTSNATDNGSLSKLDQRLIPYSVAQNVNTIILDFSRVTFVDSTALKMLELVVKSYDIVEIRVVFCDFNPLVYDSLKKVQFFKSLPDDRFAHDVHGAVQLSQNSQA